jgi:diaminopimelate epimerase
MRFSPITFEKWHALGNSYLLLERAELGGALEPQQARRLCDSGEGVGADGVVEVLSADGPHAEIAIWNPDGSRAEFSGNGTRIAAAWLLRHGGEEVTVSVSGRHYAAKRTDGEIELEVGAVDVSEPETIVVDGEAIELTRVSVGNPHAVVRREPRREELLRLGPLLERHERFPERTNVQLVRIEDTHAISAVVWERGAGETSASGSSAVAVAAAAIANGWCESPIKIRMPGGELGVAITADSRATLTGPAEQICQGEVDVPEQS